MTEAVEQWLFAVRKMAKHLPRYEELVPARGVQAIWGNVMFPLTNQAVVCAPVDEAQLEAAATAVCKLAEERGKPWMFSVPEPAITSDAPLRGNGLERGMTLTYMETDRIAPPLRELPALECRAMKSYEDCAILCDLNSFAYGMPAEWTRESCDTARLEDAYGAIGYVEGQPVSCAMALKNADTINVVCVATAPEQQRRGYAETVMRHVVDTASDRWSPSRSVLHATEAGFPIYERMGYKPSVRFGVWSPPHA